jgi:hypothetical protein
MNFGHAASAMRSFMALISGSSRAEISRYIESIILSPLDRIVKRGTVHDNRYGLPGGAYRQTEGVPSALGGRRPSSFSKRPRPHCGKEYEAETVKEALLEKSDAYKLAGTNIKQEKI